MYCPCTVLNAVNLCGASVALPLWKQHLLWLNQSPNLLSHSLAFFTTTTWHSTHPYYSFCLLHASNSLKAQHATCTTLAEQLPHQLVTFMALQARVMHSLYLRTARAASCKMSIRQHIVKCSMNTTVTTLLGFSSVFVLVTQETVNNSDMATKVHITGLLQECCAGQTPEPAHQATSSVKDCWQVHMHRPVSMTCKAL
eukprot:GHRR01023437.1.p1 GENE.GHRR01023437.1~~GHRR01023437.1.p1  ORF type:complete len:198 (-),score=44.69 GHRR01023437.1:657-1250(-)